MDYKPHQPSQPAAALCAPKLTALKLLEQLNGLKSRLLKSSMYQLSEKQTGAAWHLKAQQEDQEQPGAIRGNPMAAWVELETDRPFGNGTQIIYDASQLANVPRVG